MQPFIRHRPTVAPVPLVFDSPHSGTHYPADFVHLPPRALVRKAEDTHVEALYASVTEVGATLIEALFPRAYIDPNRHVTDLDPGVVEEAWPGPIHPSRKTELGIGLVWRLAQGGVPMYAHPLPVAEIERRIALCYEPYHAAVAETIDERHRQFGRVWYIDCHSMPAVGDAMSDDPGRPRADFVLGDRDGSTCEPEFTGFVARTLGDMGYSVAINDPYKGVELVRRHGRPTERRHSLQIEVNRKLYMDEGTLERTPGFAALQADLARLAEALADYVRSR
jgi:N-formylglutamate amidohydrolase